jgi:hypothetical protein
VVGLSVLAYVGSGGAGCTDACGDIFLAPAFLGLIAVPATVGLFVSTAVLFIIRRTRIQRWE